MSSTLAENLNEALNKHFEFQQFKPGQKEVIEHLLAGRSAAAVFPTGGGKSLCYQLPALLLPGLTLVVSPLIALMKDQIDALRKRGIAAARLDSSLALDEYREVMDRVRGGELRLLYVAPERFNNERFREAIRHVRISLFAVDEAHCISEWGHAFRPDYLKLAEFARQCNAERTFALTATATEKVLDDVCRLFSIAPSCAVRTPVYRPNLTLLTTPVACPTRDGELVERTRKRPNGSTIVYVTLQKTAERVAEILTQAGFNARPYHAGLEDKVRAATQNWFIDSHENIVVATIAFGMGIDKANIRYVYHYNLPKSLENYAQEIGRAGRDGEPSTCEMLVCLDDLNILENFIYGDTPSRISLTQMIDELFAQSETFDVSIYELSNRHDIRTLVVKTVLTYLELDGYLDGGTPFYSKYQFMPKVSSGEILSRFEGERREFLANLFRQASKAKTWFSIDLDEAVKALNTERRRIVAALDYLGEQGLLEVRSSGVRLRFRHLKHPKSRDELAESLHTRMVQREAHEIERLNQVVQLTFQNGCQVSALGAHFGEPLEAPCGHCSWCISGGQTAKPPERIIPAIDDITWRKVLAARHDHSDVLDDARQLSRFLCGVTSPRLTKAKLSKHPLFGALASVPFRQVLAKADDGS